MSAQSECPPNLDFEQGSFDHWKCYVGNTNVRDGENQINLDSGGQRPNRHEIVDAFYSQSKTDNYGKFPLSCPNGSGYSIKLGNNDVGGKAERVVYSFTIPPDRTDYSITYYYAVVFQDPGHQTYEQPRFTARVYADTTNTIIGCATYEYIATSNLPGFKRSNVGDNVWYKEWTPVTISLSGLAGKSIRLEFTTADCTLGGHFGYAYIDVNSGCTTPVTGWAYCEGAESMELHAPYGYSSYQWWNSNFTQLIGDSIDLKISPPPPNGTVINLDLIPYSGFGCRDTVRTIVREEKAPPTPQAYDTSYCQFSKPYPLVATTNPNYRPLWYTSELGMERIPFGALPQTDTPGITHYYVSQVSPGGCEGPRQKIAVKIFSTPVVSISADDPDQCLGGNSFTFLNNTTNTDSTTKYSWEINDRFSDSSVIHPVKSFDSAGVYEIKLTTVNSNICFGKDSIKITVYNSPLAGFTINDTTQCQLNNNFYFNNTTQGNGFQFNSYWDFGDNTNSYHDNPSHSFDTSGVYVIWLKTNNPGCIDSIQKAVLVHPDPRLQFTVNDNHQCLNENLFQYSNYSDITEGTLTYLWRFGDGSISTDTNTTHHFTQHNYYTTYLVAESEKGCRDSLGISIIVAPSPIIDMHLSGKVDLCVGDTLNFNASVNPVWGSINYMQWMHNNNDLPGQNSNLFQTDSAGVYQLTATNTDGCTTLSNQYHVTVNPYPTGNISSSIDYVCESLAQEIKATGGNTYRWFRNGIEIIPDSLSSYFATQGGVYKVALVSSVGCTTYLPDSIPLDFIAKPKPDFIYSNQCAFRKIDFTDKSFVANSGSVNYLWNFGDGVSSQNTEPFHTYFNGDSTYAVSLTITPVKCPLIPVTITKDVFVEKPVKAQRYVQVEILKDKAVTLPSRDIGVAYKWKPALWLNSTGIKEPIFKGQKDQDYVITITTKNGCIISDSLLVKVFEKQEIFVPTAFTPNNDQLNDRLKPIAPSIKNIHYFRVFNKLGQMIYESQDRSGWDGYYKGYPQPADTYVWMFAGENIDGKIVSSKGFVVLIR